MTAQRTPPQAKHAKKPFKEGQLDYFSCTVVFLPPVMVAVAALLGVEANMKTALVGLIFYTLNMLGITMGYHRLFSHRAFTASAPLQWALAVLGAGGFQGSIKWWCRKHRIHHRYVDTEKDPYNGTRGFWFTHVGWMLIQRDPDLLGRVDISDLKANPIVMYQHVNFLPMAIGCGVLAPTLVCGLGWGDWMGGYFYAAILKIVLVHHSTFCINSLAHTSMWGASQNFSTDHTSQDSVLCALLTLGEGYHNFHHEFANDYRNGIQWYHYDPTKWAIRLSEMLGFASNLVRVPNDVIKRNIYDMRHLKHSEALSEVEGKIQALRRTVATPAIMTWADVQTQCQQGKKLVVVGDYVLDMQKTIPTGAGYSHDSLTLNWYANHPGGKAMLDAYVGKDATDAMGGDTYKHSQGAFNLLQQLRVAHIDKTPTSESVAPKIAPKVVERA